MRVVFWGSFVFVAYTYLGYPAWLWLRSRICAQPVRRERILPKVSVLMAIHNEEKVLEEKLRNLADLNYPADLWEVVAVSDGSTDATNRILAARESEHFQFLALPQHVGKASALNRGMETARGEIVVFTDARQILEDDALLHLAANFADPSVGGASGELMLGDRSGAAASEGLGLYWRMEKKIREWEGATGSVVGATGALYAVRKELLVSLPAATVLDDVYLPLQVVRQGKRLIFEPEARAWDSLASPDREFRRKVRTLAGNYQLLQLAPWLLTRENPLRFEFVSHKLLRLFVPFALVGMLLSALFLRETFYRTVLALQVGFCALSTLTIFRSRLGLVSRLADTSLTFLVLNTAAAAAFVLFVRGKRAVWAR